MYYQDIDESFTVHAAFVGRVMPICTVTPAAAGDVEFAVANTLLEDNVLYCLVITHYRGE